MIEVMTELMERIVRLEQRLSNVATHGPVHEVDTKKKMARLRLGGTDAEPYLSPWVPYGQWAGKLKIHTPPTKGQNMTLFAPTGDPQQGALMPMTWNNEFGSPSEKEDENVMTYGNAKVEVRGDEIVVTVPKFLLKCGGSTFELTGGGLKMVASDYEFT